MFSFIFWFFTGAFAFWNFLVVMTFGKHSKMKHYLFIAGSVWALTLLVFWAIYSAMDVDGLLHGNEAPISPFALSRP